MKPSEKYYLTVKEATMYFSIGENTIRRLMTDPECNFVLKVGNKRLIKKHMMEKYLDDRVEI